MRLKRIFKMMAILIACHLSVTTAFAQRPNYGKLSPMLRSLTRQETAASRTTKATPHKKPVTVCAFVKVADGGEDVLKANGCRILTQIDDICIADIPLNTIGKLSLDNHILRIEANRGMEQQTDTMAWYLNTLPVYEGQNLPQAYTGKGVVVGVMDIGFDLTHPNFYSRDTTTYRIQQFWDMLSNDTLNSDLYVGRDYIGREELIGVAHARDGLKQSHGTHTLGIAAGSGYDSPYRGMAPESDICIVANAVSDDINLIDSADYYKFTFATDALGFKYIFDYAESQGKPCVINFSEGSCQDFWGYDLLYYEMLEKLTGPGRILVVSAGNYGDAKTWFRKPVGEASMGAFLNDYNETALMTFKSANDFALRLVAYDERSNDTLFIDSRFILQQEDSVWVNPLSDINNIGVTIEAYPSCYNPEETCFDVTIKGKKWIGSTPISFEVIGSDADIEAYCAGCNMVTNTSINPSLAAGEKSHSILSPSSAPSVISVGATYYRPGVINYKGEWMEWANTGGFGEWCRNSSVGPTFDGRIKPDVVAPGMYVISSYSSYFLEHTPKSSLIDWDVAHFDFNGRTYAWNACSGTSMSSPAVAGAIALWLQAKPDLTREEVMDVFSHTCRHYDESMTFPNNYFGYGEIDVYSGLLYLLGASNIEGVSTTHTSARISYDNGQLTIALSKPAEVPTQVRIFSLEGKQVFTTMLPANQSTYTLQTPSLQKAIYVVQLNEPNQVGSSTLIAVK